MWNIIRSQQVLPVVGVCIFTIILSFFVSALGGFNFVSGFSNQATQTIGTLVIVTAIIERSVAAINAATNGVRMNEALFKERKARNTIDDIENNKIRDDNGNALNETAKQKKRSCQLSVLSDVDDDKKKIESAAQRARIIDSFIFGLLVSTAGIRTLSNLVVAPCTGWQAGLFNAIDIVVTAGLIAGGSQGLNTILKLIKTQQPKQS